MPVQNVVSDEERFSVCDHIVKITDSATSCRATHIKILRMIDKSGDQIK